MFWGHQSAFGIDPDLFTPSHDGIVAHTIPVHQVFFGAGLQEGILELSIISTPKKINGLYIPKSDCIHL